VVHGPPHGHDHYSLSPGVTHDGHIQQTLPPMSTFRGTGVSTQAGAPHSPVMYNQQLGPHHPHPHTHTHTQHSPAIQNDTIVGKAMQTMFTSTEMFTPTGTDQIMAPSPTRTPVTASTPVNSPPPITSQSQPPTVPPTQQQSSTTWQQLTSPHRLENGLQNGSYPSELVPRELHMVSFSEIQRELCKRASKKPN